MPKRLIYINPDLSVVNSLLDDVVSVEKQSDDTVDITVVRDGVAVVITVTGVEKEQLVDLLNDGATAAGI